MKSPRLFRLAVTQSFIHLQRLTLPKMGVFERKHGQWVADLAMVIAAVCFSSLGPHCNLSPTDTSPARARLLSRAPTHITPRSGRLRQKRGPAESTRRDLPPPINLPISGPRR